MIDVKVKLEMSVFDADELRDEINRLGLKIPEEDGKSFDEAYPLLNDLWIHLLTMTRRVGK